MAKVTRPPLTKARQDMGNRVFKGDTLNYPAGVSTRYTAALVSIVMQMTSQTEREVKRWAKEHMTEELMAASMDASPASQARILTNGLANRFADMFKRRAPAISEAMVKQASAASSAALHASLTKASGGLSLKTSQITPVMNEVYKASIAENVSLIKSIATEYQQKIQGAVLRSITQGGSVDELEKQLFEFGASTRRRAQLMALDQTRKVFNTSNAKRMDALGLKSYEWIHTGGSSHPRRDHIEMSGKQYFFADPPVIDQRTGEKGIPGQAVNCRCRMRPLIALEDSESKESTKETAQ